MMRMMLSCCLMAMLSGVLFAQDSEPQNFTGSWMLSAAQSDYGPFPAPDLMIRTVKHAQGVISMSTRQSGVSGEVTSDLRYTTDGEPSTNGENIGAAGWYSGKLVIDSARQMQGALLTSREVWSLSTDGQKLTIEAHITIPQQGEYDVKQVFVKAPSL